ncbi:MAG: TRAP transporter small permease [Roseibium album]|uniref:TRAP transporter small permease protein n=1 Tax=Roseibium album TaxID=311410 RepID=A0A0M6ZS20_9HYPH|nr:TRAP transporter small permease [Roseibium album]MBG6144746.1 TRAP-type C4-dicarboxylate transport system permease small subunit [Labrenzia sp. EL_142]MBG6157043.1 TRAP-type C4-dicarboxylate transport system permease small subunit [Labrenzia sp. EL_162]MBG6163349.1 TRAP-type C4-dicarboxylate transport system permease small subunit [Labrenzia sp. EL_195]MBG6172292.1 TRAP-type C4-dicarboxylate transport system permease small subunit [Labrenzia sp. EL_132]MBG6195016.1 TRAP-type C4-dicarboxylat
MTPSGPDNTAPRRFESLRRGATFLLGFACLLVLAAMIGLTCLDVVARYLFNSPVNGAYELTQLLLASLIFLALPLTTAAGEHIEVELLDGLKSKALKYLGAVCAGVATVAVFAIVALELSEHAEKLQRREQVTDSLEIPLYLIGWLGTASFAISAVVAIFWTLRRLREKA